MRYFSFTLIFLAVQTLFGQQNAFQYVNPFIGTGGHGHTFPGPTLPFGMVQLSPDTRIDGSWDGCGGYHYSDSLIYGFSHTHLSGTGVSDYGDIMIMPVGSQEAIEPDNYKTAFSHQTEIAKAGYYAVWLPALNVRAELTATARTGMHRYTFNNGNPQFVIDLNHRDKLLGGDIRQLSEKVIEGYRRSDAWARDQLLYFRMEFDQPIEKIEITNEQTSNGRYGSNTKLGAWIKFNENTKQVQVKVSISAVDENGARKNMLAENPTWRFDEVRTKAEKTWQNELEKIQVKGGSEEQRHIFYTALYHTMVAPNVFSDVDGRYRGHDFKIHESQNPVYTVFSLWDTFRGLHPLLSIIDEKRTVDFINTFLLQYKQGGRLPVWELAANETECMIGYHAVPVIADAMKKGIRGFDYELAFGAAKYSAMMNHLGLDALKEKGFIEIDDEHESVSKNLEYAYDDWCIAEMAKMLGKIDDEEYFRNRSNSWQNLFDPSTQNMRPRINGGWIKPFNPSEINNHFTEGNSWQYSFFVPHDIPELMQKMGGMTAFEKKLDDLFTTSSKTTGREQADVTGLIGQYAHGNEPSHHMAYLYNYAKRPAKTQKLVQQILAEFYKNAPDGLIGNEDCGQMSAWYVLSAIGFYPITPGSNQYAVGTPMFDEVKLKTNNGWTTIVAKNKSDENNFVQSVEVIENGKRTILSDWFLTHSQLVNTDKIVFNMASSVCSPRNDAKAESENYYVAAPIIEVSNTTFRDSVLVTIKSLNENAYLWMNSGAGIHQYEAPFWVNNSTEIVVYDKREGQVSPIAKSQLHKIPNNWSVQITGKYNPQYSAGGDIGLVDGLLGDEEWRKGRWQGYQDQDFEVVVDMKVSKSISEFGASFLQDTRSWILMPTEAQFYYSKDGKTWKSVGVVANTYPVDNYENAVRKLTVNANVKARYFKVVAKNFGTLPKWHQGAGFEAFIFVDEVWAR